MRPGDRDEGTGDSQSSTEELESKFLTTRRSRFSGRLVGYVAAGLAALISLAAAAAYLTLHGSLPNLEGELALSAIGAPATIERDAFGAPTLRARSRVDLAFATGFVHAQDRFFQMDLMRRSAAGELAALLGPSLVEADRVLRVHQFASVAPQIVARAEPHQRELLEAYAAGVNAGLEALSVRPWEYLILRVVPQRWEPEDSVLAAFSMYLSLHESTGASELAREHLRRTLAPELFAFMHPVGTEWDAPIEGGPWRTPPIPGPDVANLREVSAGAERAAPSGDSQPSAVYSPFSREGFPGSNAWAVAGAYTHDGVPMLANDMHLGLRLPNVWYHARLVVEQSGGEDRDLVGVTLPGLPFLIAGSNGRLAWGYTNSYGDWTDLVIVEVDEQDPTHYLTPDGPEPFELRREQIAVNGGPAQTFEVRMTRWGPVVREEANGRMLALAWTAHRPEATNLELASFETSVSVEMLFDHANRTGAPVQNIVAVDADSNIGWSLMGQLPQRGEYDPSVPSSWRTSGAGWLGWRAPSEHPRVINPDGGRLWSANNRMIDAQRWFELLGEGRYDTGARAGQIRDALRSLSAATETDFAALQTDDRALFLARWRDLLLELLEDAPPREDPRYREAHRYVQAWSGRAAADDVGYRLVRAFRNQVRSDVYDMLTEGARASAAGVELVPSPQFEGPLWALVTERPLHLLSPKYESWSELLVGSLDAMLREASSVCGELSRCTWGRENMLSMRHPLSSAIPFIARWVDMPSVPMDGDIAMPRVQGPSFGASERLVVSPGRESQGLIQLPGGPVNHPLSPFYSAGHEEWVRGEPRPLLPGEAKHVLRLTPR